MSEMEERVARAICPWSGKRNADCPNGCRVCVANARDAIEAMREPTEGMVTGGRIDLHTNEEGALLAAEAKQVWQAMIDEALK